MGTWDGYPDQLTGLELGKAQRFRQIAIVAGHHGTVVPVVPCIVQKVHREVHIRTLFLGLADECGTLRRCRVGERRANLVG